MAQQQQTVLRVKTNVPNESITITGNTTLDWTYSTNVSHGGFGTILFPYTGSTTGGTSFNILLTVSGYGQFFYEINTVYDDADPFPNNDGTFINVQHKNYSAPIPFWSEYAVDQLSGNFNVIDGDKIQIETVNSNANAIGFTFYVYPDDVLNNPQEYQYDFLDLYSDIPLKINKSFAEVQDISKRNSDYSVGLQLPGSKKNNRFFENFFNVDQQTLFFDVTKRVPIDVLINDETYFNGYLKLNKVSVLNSKVEYDVTLYSQVGDLFGKMGNNLLRDLDFDDTDFHFNHVFNLWNTVKFPKSNPLMNVSAVPALYFYPIVHNGYNYSGDTVNFTGGTSDDQSRLYTSTIVTGVTSSGDFYSGGGKDYRINSPSGIFDTQLKPALSVWGLVNLIFKTYGFTIDSDFFKTPWFRTLYMYGYFNSDTSKFSKQIQTYVPPSFVCTCKTYIIENESAQEIEYRYTDCTTGEIQQEYLEGFRSIQICACEGSVTAQWGVVTVGADCTPPQPERNIGDIVPYEDGDYVDFSVVIDDTIKQIDFLSSIAKKFNLIFTPDPNQPNKIKIEPYDYYVGSGDIKDWSDKLSFDNGFTVQPAQNFVESEILLTDLEDGDDGNKQFKDLNNRIYGENLDYNITDFKSQTKEIKTIFSPEVIRIWDNNIGLPLGINYATSNSTTSEGDTEKVSWQYKGLKSKPKLFFTLGAVSPFIDTPNEVYYMLTGGTGIQSFVFRVSYSDGSKPGGATQAYPLFVAPLISHTFNAGNDDENKINNDNISILFNSEVPGDIGIGVPTFNVYTNQDVYNLFYENRVDNIFNKNTRFLNGKFNLKLSDIKDLNPSDVIKIGEQYFTWNKISNYNLTNPELTEVELIQFNKTVRTYPERYFKYRYCDSEYEDRFYRWKTNFTNNNNMQQTHIFWSTTFDYFIGVNGGTGKTIYSTIKAGGGNYSYEMTEITKSEYDAINLNHTDDIYDPYFIGRSDWTPYGSDADYIIWLRGLPSGYTVYSYFLNLGTSCADINTKCSTNGYILSTPAETISPTPSPSPTPTPTPTPAMGGLIGSLLVTYDNDHPYDYFIRVNGTYVVYNEFDINDLYITNVYTGDTVDLTVNKASGSTVLVDIKLVEYTTDDEDGDNGIKETTLVYSTYGSGVTLIAQTIGPSVTFNPATYKFEYRIRVIKL